MTDAAIERRYRRWLIWFPAEHRRLYGEEMVGVLLASAPDGQDRPGLADMTDLAAGGLRTRFRSLLNTDQLDPHWRDALSAFSVAAPVLMLLYLSSQVYNIVRYNLRPFRPPFEPRYAAIQTVLFLLTVAVLAAVVALAIAPALSRLQHRRAVIVAFAVPAILGAVATISYDVLSNQASGESLGFTILFVMEVIAVTMSRDPGRGWRLLGWKGLVIWAVVAVLALLETVAFQAFAGSTFDRAPVQIAILVVALCLVLIFAPPAIKRMLALMAVPAYPILGFVPVYSIFFAYRFDNGPNLAELLYLPTLVIAVLVGLSAWQSTRGRQRAAAGSTSG